MSEADSGGAIPSTELFNAMLGEYEALRDEQRSQVLQAFGMITILSSLAVAILGVAFQFDEHVIFLVGPPIFASIAAVLVEQHLYTMVLVNYLVWREEYINRTSRSDVLLWYGRVRKIAWPNQPAFGAVYQDLPIAAGGTVLYTLFTVLSVVYLATETYNEADIAPTLASVIVTAVWVAVWAFIWTRIMRRFLVENPGRLDDLVKVLRSELEVGEAEGLSPGSS